MTGFSTSTYAILYSKIKSLTTGISNIQANGNQIVFTLNDKSQLTITIPNQLNEKEKANLVKAIPTLNKMIEDSEGNLTYAGNLLLTEKDFSKLDIQSIHRLLQVLMIDMDGKALINNIKIDTKENDITMNGNMVLFAKDKEMVDINFETDISW